MSLVLGIDLGTTNSCAAIFQNGRVEIIKTKENDTVTPSFVYYDSSKVVVGKSAINLSTQNPQNGIFDVKRMIGRSYDDLIIQKAPIYFPFKVIKEHNNEPIIELDFKNGEKQLVRPEEVSAEILMKIMDDSFRQVEQKIRNVVITVPAYFTTRQRQATESAARIAGLNVLKLLSEPTAAALAFFQNDPILDRKTVLVYDLGGGTFDVSIIKFERGEGNVIAVGGDAFLGGRDFDDNLVKHCMEIIKNKFKYAITDQVADVQRRSWRRLRQACEEAKKQLSEENVLNTKIELSYFSGFDVEIDITREKFEEINIKFFKRTIEIVEETLKESKILKEHIDDIILVGGSTRIPKIEQMVRDFFDMKPLNKKINRDEGVAVGAALQAALLSNHPSQNQRRFMNSLSDVCPLSLGIEIFSTTQENVSVLIKRNTKIPAVGCKKYKTASNDQTQIDLNIFEGENKSFKDNFHLDLLTIEGVTPKKAGKVEVEVRFDIDKNGILHVSATESTKNITKTLTINLQNGQLADAEIQRMQENLYVSHEYDYIYVSKDSYRDSCSALKTGSSDEEETDIVEPGGDKEEVKKFYAPQRELARQIAHEFQLKNRKN